MEDVWTASDGRSMFVFSICYLSVSTRAWKGLYAWQDHDIEIIIAARRTSDPNHVRLSISTPQYQTQNLSWPI